jgi:2-haloalkanoic acid dehalogenase type II
VGTITFDCYGTLIDWRAGLQSSLAELFELAFCDLPDGLFDAYVQTEAEVEGGAYQSYRRVLTATAERLAKRFNFDLPPGLAELLAETLPHWAPFADTNEALVRLKRRYRLGVLSNIDRDLFAGTALQFDVEFDFVVTAEDVQSYKPGQAHFQWLLSRHIEHDRVLHVAQSLFHDGVPAQGLGIAFVWINRYKEVNTTAVRPLAEFADLKSLADATVGHLSG